MLHAADSIALGDRDGGTLFTRNCAGVGKEFLVIGVVLPVYLKAVPPPAHIVGDIIRGVIGRVDPFVVIALETVFCHARISVKGITRLKGVEIDIITISPESFGDYCKQI